MKKISDYYIEAEPGFFIEKRQYFNLLAIGILPWEMRSHLRGDKKIESLVGKPLSFQEKMTKEEEK